MFEYLILNRKFEAAKKWDQTNANNFIEQSMLHFNRGNREQFFQIFSLLRKQSKLEFYLRVYFFIYNIHPAIASTGSHNKKGSIPENQVTAFKDFLDNQGAELAKTNQFLQFYALPFIKKPIQHEAFKNIFKKQWIKTLKEKLTFYLQQEQKRLKMESKKILGQNIQNSGQESRLQQKVKEMEKINKQLFDQVKQFAEKCNILEDSHKMMAQGFNSHMMEAQSKWFQITKELVNCSKSLIQMLIASNSQFLGDKKFLKIKQRTNKYEKFVNKKFDDLVSQSQDISIFDRPSLNELSYSVTPYTQKSNGAIIKDLSTIIGVDQYIPTDFHSLKNHFRKCSLIQKNSILNGFLWRIAKSKDKTIRRLNISALFKEDFLGFINGQVTQLIASHQTMRATVRLLQSISQDSIGRKFLFINHNIHTDFISLMQSCNDKSSLEAIINMLGVISSQKKFKEELIRLDIIEACITLLRNGHYEQNQMILENITTILLNTIMLDAGLSKFTKEKDIFDILKKYLRVPFKIVKTLIYGIIFALLENQQLFKRAHNQRMPQFFEDIQKIDPSISKKQLYYLKDKLSKYQPKIEQNSQDAEQDDDEEAEDSDNEDFHTPDIENMFKHHEQLVEKYSLKGKEAKKQYKQVKQFYSQIKNVEYVPKFYQPNQVNMTAYNSPKNYSSNSKQLQTPYIRDPNKQGHEIKSRKIDNFVSPKPKQKQQPLRKDRDFRIKQKDHNKSNIQKEGRAKNDKYSKRGDENGELANKLRKSVSADKGIGRSREKDQKIYESHRLQRNRVSEFKNSDEKVFRSPQAKKIHRQQVLKQLNQQLQKGQLKRKCDMHPQNVRQNKISTHVKTEKIQRKSDREGQAFQPRPKLRRTPPKDEIM